MLSQAAFEVLHHARIGERHRGQIDLHRITAGGDLGPARDHPTVDLTDQAVLLGDGQKLPGSDDLAVGHAHAQQQLALH